MIAAAVLIKTALPAAAAPEIEQKTLTVGDGQELDVVQNYGKMEFYVRASNHYFCVQAKGMDVIVLACAPDWTVTEIAPERKMYRRTPLQDWLRRGIPIHFLHLGPLPDWPTIARKNKQLNGLPVTIFALPYVTRNHQIVPLKKGSVGEVTAYTGFKNTPIGKIQSRLYRLPVVDGLLLTSRLWDVEKADGKVNSILIYSGGDSAQMGLTLKKLWVTGESPLPSFEKYKLCQDSHQIWSNKEETDDMGDLIR